MSEINSKVMDKLTHGLYVCTVRDGECVNGCIINRAFQVELDSNIISITLNKSRNFICPCCGTDGDFFE